MLGTVVVVVGTLEDLQDSRLVHPNLVYPVLGKTLKLARFESLAIHCTRSVCV